ncbi:hypothetical protein SO802_008490 [Lithocarpus litseifolius]|uniref:Uncharacterized protein n=1 Tax=Lithocarpus litseifolius TaxID=425828 RepID=A0AAW2DBC9_9ROSI
MEGEINNVIKVWLSILVQLALLGRFVALACLPIKIQQNTPPKKINHSLLKSHLNGHNKENPPPKPIEKSKNPAMSHLNYAIKGILFSILACLYHYSDYMHPKVIMLLYCFHIYFLLEFMLAIAATLAQALLGIELQPQFNELYLTASLQDFWGWRWNLIVTKILCFSIYNPTCHTMTCRRPQVGSTHCCLCHICGVRAHA